MYCNQCGYEIKGDVRLCPQCGSPVNSASEGNVSDTDKVMYAEQEQEEDASAQLSNESTSFSKVMDEAKARSKRRIPIPVLVALIILLAAAAVFAGYYVYTTYAEPKQDEQMEQNVDSQESSEVDEESEEPTTEDLAAEESTSEEPPAEQSEEELTEIEEEKTENSVAAFGDYALIVQMIGGDGALAATDAVTLSNLQSSGVAVSATVAWADGSGDTSSINIDAIIESGAKAILVDDYESYIQSIPQETLQNLEDYGVAWVSLPNLSTSTNIKECVNSIGEMLQGSTVAAYGTNAEARASEYCARHDSMISVNGGLAEDNSSIDSSKPLQYSDGYSNDPDGLDYSENTVTHTLLINYWADDATLNLFNMNFGSGAAYAAAGYYSTPVSFYMQAGGSINTAASRPAMAATGEIPVLQFVGVDGSNVPNSWSGSTIPGNANYNNGFGYHALLDSGVDESEMSQVGNGLGSDAMPKAIVTSSDIKNAIVESSSSESSLYHPWGYAQVGMTYGLIGIPDKVYTVIGNTMRVGTVGEPNPIYPNGQIDADDILVNPQGYFCDWTGGTVESFLESGFVAAYINGSTTGYTRDQWRQDVIEFYSWAWGINADMNRIDPNSANTVN